MRALSCTIVLLLVAVAMPLQAAPLRIAAASDLRFALPQIVAAYRERHPDDEVEVIYGSSGRFRAQIEHGAPFDLFFSADLRYPLQLREVGLASGEVRPYGRGRIALWSRTEDAAQLELADLADARFRRIVIANPSHAPYGARAEEALRSKGLWQAVQPRLVYAENIAHALQVVDSGAAEVGIIALALLLHPAALDKGGYHLIDDSWHEPLEQGFIITRRARDDPRAQRFADFMAGDEALAVMRAFGFEQPRP